MKIMLIDDQPICNFIMRKFISIKMPDAEIIDYTDPFEAFEQMDDDRPDLIFLDLNMPGMTGWDFLDDMKIEGKSFKVAILTSSTNPLDLNQASNYNNVSGFYSKPLDPSELSRIMVSIESKAA